SGKRPRRRLSRLFMVALTASVPLWLAASARAWRRCRCAATVQRTSDTGGAADVMAKVQSESGDGRAHGALRHRRVRNPQRSSVQRKPSATTAAREISEPRSTTSSSLTQNSYFRLRNFRCYYFL